MDVTMTIDLGMIIAALAPTLAIVVASRIASRNATTAAIQVAAVKTTVAQTVEDVKTAVAETAQATTEKLTGIHTLVNDQLTKEKMSRLEVMRAQKRLLEKMAGDNPSTDDSAVIGSLGARIEELMQEIARRDVAAASLTAAQK